MSIIGAGRVGSTLALLFSKNGFPIVSIIGRTIRSARMLARVVHCRHYSSQIETIHPSTEILVFAVPEPILETIISRVAKTSLHPRYAFHVSGVHTSDVLKPLKKKGTVIFSLHPIQTFPHSISFEEQLSAMEGIPYGFEGERSALRLARTLVTKFGGTMFIIPKEKKILYHTACVFASNYTIALLSVVEELLKSISPKATLSIVRPLIETSIRNAVHGNVRDALTGPIARGDTETLRKHIQALSTVSPSLISLYKQLGVVAAQIARSTGTLTLEDERRILEHLKLTGDTAQ